MISLRFLYVSCRSLAWWAIALIRQNCALLVRPSNPPLRPRRSAIQITEQKRTRCMFCCGHRGGSFYAEILDYHSAAAASHVTQCVPAEEWLSILKVQSKWLSLICKATFRHPVRSRTTWALQVSMWLLENKLPHRANVAIAESAHQLYES